MNNKEKLKIAFFGTGDFSANILKSLIDNFQKDLEIKLVVSQADKPVGRKKILEPTAVKKVAQENNLEILQPEKLRPSSQPSPSREKEQEQIALFYEKLKSLDLDFIVVVAYGKIVPKEVLIAPKYGCINIHGSILPKYRGASPIQESIKSGDKKTGLTIMYMSEGMDEGDILNIAEVEIGENDKTPDIFKKFEEIGPNLLVKTLKGIISGEIKSQKQDEKKATYCSKIKKEDGEIDFKKETAKDIYNKFRAYYPWPGIYSYYNGKKLNIEKISSPQPSPLQEREPGSVLKIDKKTIGIVCFDKKILILKQVKLEGKKSMDIISFVNGNKEFLNYKF